MSEQHNSNTFNSTGRPVQEFDLAGSLEVLNGLLNELTDVLDVRDVFERVSSVVQRVLPHDLMGVVEINEGGDRIRLYAGAGAAQKHTPSYDVPLPESLKSLVQPWDAQIIEDFPNRLQVRRATSIDSQQIGTFLGSAPIRAKH